MGKLNTTYLCLFTYQNQALLIILQYISESDTAYHPTVHITQFCILVVVQASRFDGMRLFLLSTWQCANTTQTATISIPEPN